MSVPVAGVFLRSRRRREVLLENARRQRVRFLSADAISHDVGQPLVHLCFAIAKAIAYNELPCAKNAKRGKGWGRVSRSP